MLTQPAIGSQTLVRIVDALRQNGEEVRQTEEGKFIMSCPAHDDAHPSFSLSDGSAGVVAHCFSGCPQGEAFTALVQLSGLETRDFFYQSRPRQTATIVTLSELSEVKRLPVEFFESYEITNGVGAGAGIHIPYRSESGQVVGVRIRRALRASEGSYWAQKGTMVSAYGAWMLPEFRQGKTLFLVEGETDALTGWFHGLPVIGIPGKSVARAAIRNTPGLFDGFEHVCLIEEPDDYEAGMFQRQVRRAMTDVHYQGKLYVMRLPAKDLSELHIQKPDPEEFMQAVEQSHLAAVDNIRLMWGPPEPIPAVTPDMLPIVRWVTRTTKLTFTLTDCRNALRGVSGAMIAEAFQVLERIGWIRKLPPERRRGRPSPKYRRNPQLTG